MAGFFILACKTPRAGFFTLPEPTDTRDQPIEFQTKREYVTRGVHVDNLFDGARLNDFHAINDTLYRATISPENTPINASAYFAFRIWSNTTRMIDLELYYTEHEHRYIPKLSLDGKHWIPMHANDFDTIKAPNIATLHVQLGPEKLWIAAQEIINSSTVMNWAESTALRSEVNFSIVGKSKLGRDVPMLDIFKDDKSQKDMVVILSRQHPPEVTGYMAMKSFVKEILSDSKLSSDFLSKFRILVFPNMNPDGVDLGHWRHNAGGIDLNRDWAYYRQKETELVANYIVKTASEDKNKVILGLDFHSTQEDLYYTFDESMVSVIPHYKDYWLAGIDQAFPDYTPDDQPFPLESPISKAWFYLQFGAESVTYEIGDETDREFVREKAKHAAQEMMKLLIFRSR